MVAGVTIPYYTPFVQQADGSSSSAWQMIFDTRCGAGTSSMLAQAGWVQLTGDIQDYMFYEYSRCSNHTLYPPIERQDLPRATTHFNVTIDLSERQPIAKFYYNGSTQFAEQQLDWLGNGIAAMAEVHDDNDQGFGGYNNLQALTNPAWENQSGQFFVDQLNLTQNNVLGSNGTDPYVPSLPWLEMRIGPGTGFSLYDTACAN